MRAALGDANIIAWYDARFPWTITLGTGVSAWADPRGASGYGPSLAQATAGAQPAHSASARTITFDGTDDYLRVENGALANIAGGDCAISLVSSAPAAQTNNTSEGGAVLSVGAGNIALRLTHFRTAGGLQRLHGAGTGSSTASFDNNGQTGARFWHVRRDVDGANIAFGAVGGTGTEATVAPAALTAHQPTRLTVAANQADTAAEFADTVVRVVLVFAVGPSAAQRAALNQWAKVIHGATV